MYKKILIPTDGSELSAVAEQAGIEFAKQNGGEVVGIYVPPEYQYPVSMEIIPPNYPSEEEYKAIMRKTGDGYLAPMRNAAATAGVPYSEVIAFSDRPAEKIVEIARQKDCDMIFIGSHGRGGLGQLLLGSVTAKVLSLCQIPVLVYRMKKH